MVEWAHVLNFLHNPIICIHELLQCNRKKKEFQMQIQEGKKHLQSQLFWVANPTTRVCTWGYCWKHHLWHKKDSALTLLTLWMETRSGKNIHTYYCRNHDLRQLKFHWTMLLHLLQTTRWQFHHFQSCLFLQGFPAVPSFIQLRDGVPCGRQNTGCQGSFQRKPGTSCVADGRRLISLHPSCCICSLCSGCTSACWHTKVS